jgi:RimJ/RimL family protein N-acetyltransferase
MTDKAAFASLLGVSVPQDWPPGEYDRDAMQFFLEKLTQGGAEAVGWYGWYAIRQGTQDEPAILIGACGYMGPPDEAGTAEVGYSIAERWRGQGLAQEAVESLSENALRNGAKKIVAHARRDNPGSIAVLRKCGFRESQSADNGMAEFEYT